MSTDVGNVVSGNIRKASPEALALMMRNIKNNNQKKKIWIPSGAPNKKEKKTNPKKIFF